jgi:uncharacterized protein
LSSSHRRLTPRRSDLQRSPSPRSCSAATVAVFAVFLTLELTEIVLAIGVFRVAHGQSDWILHAGGWVGIITAAAAWYASAAGVVNGMSPSPVLPVGRPLWERLPLFSHLGTPMPRGT